MKIADRMNETQILQTSCSNICKLNSSREAEDNATSRESRRIPPPGEAIMWILSRGTEKRLLIQVDLWRDVGISDATLLY